MSATTTASIATAPVVCIKLELRFSNGSPSVFHRFTRGFDSVEDLKALCLKLWHDAKKSSDSTNNKETPRLALRYSDDEGDQVIISTQHEWDECVRIYYENKFNVLRINVVNEEDKQTASEKKADHQKTSEDLLSSAADEFFSMLFGPSSSPFSATHRRPVPSTPACHPFSRFCSGVQQQRPSQKAGCCGPRRQETQEPVRGGCCPALKRWGCRPDHLSQVRAAQEKRQKAVSNLLSILFNGDEKNENTLPFGGACVNLFQLYQDAVAAGNHLMDAGCLEEAGRLLAAALEVFPSDKVHLYNLACVKSLEGAVEEALKLLLEAKKNGYNNLVHAATDPDLENLRQGSAALSQKFFTEFLGQSQTVRAAESASTTSPKDNAAEQKENSEDRDDDVKSVKTSASSLSSGASTTTNGNPDAVALVNMFPNLSFAEAEQALDRFGGDLSAAVNLLLE